MIEKFNNKKILNIAIFILIIGISIFFRFWQIDKLPPSLNWDEISNGYNAYSVLKTGKDEWGTRFPLIFRAYGDYKLPLYIYFTAISEFLLGLNEISVRLISALSGIGLVVLAYLITFRLTKNIKASLLASFLTSISPWSLFLSRIAVEANLGAFLYALGSYFLICWLENFKRKEIILTILFWGLSMYAYNSCRVLVPISLIFLFVFSIKKKKINNLIFPTLLIIFISIPIIFQLINKSASARFEIVSLIDQGAINRIIETRLSSKLPYFIQKLIFNKVTFFIYYSFVNYFKNLSPVYLFLRGGSQYQFSQPLHELLFLVTAPFLVLGIIKCIFLKKKNLILLFWFFISFIPSAITKDAPHVLRTILVLPVPMVLTAIGYAWLTDFLEKKFLTKSQFLTLVWIVAILFSFYKWWNDYSSIYRVSYSWAWQYGYKTAITFVKENYSKYDHFIITKKYGEPHEFVLFYSDYDPGKYQNSSTKNWDYHADWFWVNGFDKFVFVNDWDMQNVICPNGRCVLITSPQNYPKGWNKIDSINFLDSKPAFEILEK